MRCRYVHKQLHKLASSDEAFGPVQFSISGSAPFHPFLAMRYEQTAFMGNFVSNFDEKAADFMLLVMNLTSVGFTRPKGHDPNAPPQGLNWASADLTNETADGLSTTRLAPWLKRVVEREEYPLMQGEAAPESLGLKTMSMGIGGEDGGGMTMGGGEGGEGKSGKKKRKGKKGKKRGERKEEL